jgi:DNA-binding CsgD family transcriptional regulator
MANRGLSSGSVPVSSAPAAGRKGIRPPSSGDSALEPPGAPPRPPRGVRAIDGEAPPAARRPAGQPANGPCRNPSGSDGIPQRSPDDGVPGIDELIRRLVGQALTGARRPEPGGCDALFDVEVDGLRYRLVQSEAVRSSHVPSAAPLSPREQEIVRMVSLGYPNKTIAAVLEISSWTVNTYMRRIFAKLNVASRAAMVAKVMEAGRLSDHQTSSSAMNR